MRIPNPIATTTTEAYLAYRAGFLAQADLKEKLYHPYLHIDGWLAYWTGLTDIYPNNGVPIGKNLFNKKDAMQGALLDDGYIDQINYPTAGVSGFIKVEPGDTYVVSGRNQWSVVGLYTTDKKWIRRTTNNPVTIPADCYWIRVGFQWPVDLDTVQVEEGDTATAYDVFKGDPEMLCDEEALVAYLSGVTDTYPEEIKDPYDVRIAGYLRHLASIRWPEPDYPVNNEEFYLSNLGSTTTDSGEPSSDIELDNTTEFAFASVETYGGAQQNEYTGKNLFNKNGEYTIGNGNPIVTQLDTGIKMEYNTSGTYPFAYWIIGKTSDFVGKTLTASADVTKSAPGLIPTLGIGLIKADGSSRVTKAYVSGDGSKEISWTVAEDGERDYIFISLYATNQGEYSRGDYTEYYNAQIEIGSSKTSYEPFVGGTNSPSPDYPQAVNVVTGTQNITSYGKNILNPTISVQYPDDRFLVCSSDEEDNSLTLEAVGDVGSQYCALQVEVPDANKTYTLTGLAKKLSKGDGSGEDRYNTLWVRCVTSEDGTTWSTNYVTIMEQRPVEGEVYEISGSVTGHKFYRFMFYNYAQNSVPIGTMTTYYELQLEEGDTPTPFSKYKDPASYEIDLGGLELCKIGKYQDFIYQNDDGDWYIHKEIEKYTFTGTEAWSTSPYGTNTWRLVNVILFPFDTNELQIISNIFTGVKHIDRNTTASNIIYSGNAVEFNVRNTNLTSLAEVQAATNGNYIYYALVTPTDTKITNSGLVGQLNALKEGGSYEGKTYIKVTATDPNLPALLKVEAYKY